MRVKRKCVLYLASYTRGAVSFRVLVHQRRPKRNGVMVGCYCGTSRLAVNAARRDKYASVFVRFSSSALGQLLLLLLHALGPEDSTTRSSGETNQRQVGVIKRTSSSFAAPKLVSDIAPLRAGRRRERSETPRSLPSSPLGPSARDALCALHANSLFSPNTQPNKGATS